MKAFLTLGIILATTLLPAQEEDIIRLPESAPMPSPVTTIGERQLYVVDSKVELILITSPNNVLKVVKDSGPLRIRGEFVEQPGKVTTRAFDGPFVYIVEAAGDGQSELLIVPVGVKQESEIARRMLTTRGPRPPPVDPPIPTPQPPQPPQPPEPPVPPAPVVVTGLRVIIAHETSANYPREVLNALNSTEIWKYATTKCVKSAKGVPEYRKWDIDQELHKDESPKLREIWEAAKPKLGTLPKIIISTDGVDAHVHEITSEAETLALLKRYGGN